MKLFVLSVVLFECLLSVRGEEDLFLANLKHQFGDVPKDVKLFDFLQDENNLKGLLGLHNDMCEQLVYYNDLKVNNQHRAKRDASEDTTTELTATTLSNDETANNTVDANIVSESTTADSESSSTTTVIPASSAAQRKRRDATDSSASTTNTTASSNPADDKDQQQNLNDQQPPADDQGDQQAPAGENQEAEMQAAGAAYFKQLILNVLRYILNCLMTYINMFY